MKKIAALIFLSVCLNVGSFAVDNESQEFITKFNQVVVTLRFEKFTEALPVLYELDKLDPDNANIKYLIGVCYVALHTENEKALSLLENSIKFSTNEYQSSYYKERRTPVYAIYYLGVCYTYLNRCADAKTTFDKFTSIIGDNSNEYVRDAAARMKDCIVPLAASAKVDNENRTKPVETVKPAEAIATDVPKTKPEEVKETKTTTTTVTEPKKEIKANPELTKGLKTRPVVFSKKDPIYAVQIGAFSQQLPNTNFPNLKNVKSFMDKQGTIRYVVGASAIRSTAETMKKLILEAGYKDAFIVDITAEAKFDQEVLNAFSVQSLAVQAKKWAKIEYKVQIGAYRTQEKMNEDMARKFIQIEGINQIEDGGINLLTVGSFGNYEDAKNYRKILVDQGVTDAFVIVYKNGVKSNTKEAGAYTSKDF